MTPAVPPDEHGAGFDAAAPAALITGRHLLLRPALAGDCDEFIAKVRRSRALHHPWLHAPGTQAAFQAWLTRQAQPDYLGALLVERRSGALAGVFNLSQIVRGPLCSAYLGYYALAGHEGRGLMHAGLGLLLRLAFGRLGLHRVEANIQPGNLRSIALVRGCGFALEGYSPRYLKIGGRWRDHERWARMADARHPGAPARSSEAQAPSDLTQP
jgi:ribosomal-protein-alanine N-acetyltransferase